MKRRTQAANYLFSLIRVGLGISWLQQGVFKLQADFTMTGLAQAVAGNMATPDWYQSFMVYFVEPNHALFNVLIPWGELFAGMGLITGIFIRTALSGAVFMNLNYWLANMIDIYPLQLLAAAVVLMFLKHASFLSLTTLYIFLHGRMDSNNGSV